MSTTADRHSMGMQGCTIRTTQLLLYITTTIRQRPQLGAPCTSRPHNNSGYTTHQKDHYFECFKYFGVKVLDTEW